MLLREWKEISRIKGITIFRKEEGKKVSDQVFQEKTHCNRCTGSCTEHFQYRNLYWKCPVQDPVQEKCTKINLHSNNRWKWFPFLELYRVEGNENSTISRNWRSKRKNLPTGTGWDDDGFLPSRQDSMRPSMGNANPSIMAWKYHSQNSRLKERINGATTTSRVETETGKLRQNRQATSWMSWAEPNQPNQATARDNQQPALNRQGRDWLRQVDRLRKREVELNRSIKLVGSATMRQRR